MCLTARQVIILFHLDGIDPAHASTSMVGQALGISKGRMTGNIATLSVMGLVSSRVRSDDMRLTVLSLTRAGRDLVAKAR